MKKSLLALGGALLLLVIILIVRDQMEKAAMRPQYAFPNLQQEEIVSLHVVYKQDTAALIRLGGSWLTAADSVPADSLKVATALRSIRGMQIREMVSRNPDSARLVEYGLVPEEIKYLEWETASGTRQSAHLGYASEADYASNYWKRPDALEVYRTPRRITYDLPARPMDWKARTPFPFFVYEDVVQVEVRWVDSLGKAHHYRLDRISDTAAVLSVPFESEVPRPNAAAVFVQTPQFVIDGFVEAEDPHVLVSELDDPALVVRTTMKNGTVHHFEGGPAIDGYHYARHPGAPHTHIKIRKWRVDFFKKTVDELLAEPAPDEFEEDDDAYLDMPTPGSDEFYRMQEGMQ